MEHYDRRKILALIGLLFFIISIGFAFLGTNLDINGNVTAKTNSWNIYFDNVQVKTGSITPVQEPTINTNDKTKVSFNVSFNLPGDYYEFDIDVVNAGSLDAMLDTFNILPVLTETQAKYFEYKVKYSNGAELSSKDLLEADSTQTLNVKLSLRKDISNDDLLTSNYTFSPSIELNYIQADSSAKVPTKMIDFYINNLKYSTVAGSTFDDFFNSYNQNVYEPLYLFQPIDSNSRGIINNMYFDNESILKTNFYSNLPIFDLDFINNTAKPLGNSCYELNDYMVQGNYGLNCTNSIYYISTNFSYKIIDHGIKMVKYTYYNKFSLFVTVELSNEMKQKIKYDDYYTYITLDIKDVTFDTVIEENKTYETVLPVPLGKIIKFGVV